MRHVIISATKSIDLPQYPDEAWEWLAGGPDETPSSPRQYFKAVPWLYRGVELRASAVASMPFALYRGESEFDASRDWKNRVGFLPNPHRLLWLVEAALTLEPMCYLFSDNVGASRKRLRYISPFGATPHIDPIQGLDYFERPVNGVVRRFRPATDIVYFWRRSVYKEEGAGPGDESPGKAALMAAGVLANVDEFIAGYFKRGAVKATLLAVGANTPLQERERMEHWWNNFLSGIKNAWRGKIVNADAVKATVIGEGLESLSDKELSTDRKEDIATALGVPHSLLFSNAANFATAQQDDLHFYSKTIVPECELIAETLNEQVFGPLGLSLRFLPETLDAFQEDEAQRAGALQSLVSAGLPLLLAMDLLGYELDEEQRARLEQAEAEKEQRAQALSERLAEQPPAPGPEEPEQEDQVKADLDKWRRKALKAVEKGRSANVPFESEHISPEDYARISAALAEAKSADDVRAAFASARQSAPLGDAALVLEGIRLGVEALKAREVEREMSTV